MRGNVLAALAAAAAIAIFAYFRLSDSASDKLVNRGALPGSWARSATESCNPPLPANLTIAEDLSYVADNTSGAMFIDDVGRYTMRTEGVAFPDRVFRADAKRLELLNRLGCKATYARVE